MASVIPRRLLGAVLAVMSTAAFTDTSNPIGWTPIRHTDLSISRGSILDFSSLVSSAPAGAYGQLRVRSDGQFAFSNASASPPRFFCASQPYGVEEGFPDHATADRYASQLRLHGYNIARFTFVDNVLMNNRSGDYDFDPIQLDRFHYFLAALKREGIYWILDGLTSWNGAFGDVGHNRWAKKRDVKLGLYFDPDQQAHWKELVGRILGAQNKYTNIRLIDDPALAGVILVNEGGLNYLVHQSSSPTLDRLFEGHLVSKYGSLDSARKHLGLQQDDPVTLPRRVWVASPTMQEAQRFYFKLQRTTVEWMTEYIRTLGYKGPLTALNNWVTAQDQLSRANLSWVDIHVYHDHPSNFVSPGSKIKQSSSISDAASYVRDAAISRRWGKPFSLTEYDHPFWSRWRYESGLAMGAYAAFQNWNLICRHGSGPIELAYKNSSNRRRNAIHPFGIGMDPIARAGETLAALLFLRADVSPSTHRVGILLNDKYAFEQHGGIGQLPSQLSNLGLITGIGLVGDNQQSTQPFDATIHANGEPASLTRRLAEKIGLHDDAALQSTLAVLKASGLSIDDNSIINGRFVSDTGEISLDRQARTLKVITANTEAAAFATAPGRLQVLNILKASGPALVSVSSMDGAPLLSSNKVLLILASDARNSAMAFADTGATELTKLGTLPVQLRDIRVELEFQTTMPGSLTLFALHLNGERAERIPLSAPNSSYVRFAIDTATLAHGPTTFFELVREQSSLIH